jgi:C-terminal processing protease CtpA/Prc
MKSSTLPGKALKNRGNGARARLEIDDDDQELLYVRPRVGAWRLDGGRELELEFMTPVDDSPAPPADFQAGDVIVTVNPISLVVRTFRVR